MKMVSPTPDFLGFSYFNVVPATSYSPDQSSDQLPLIILVLFLEYLKAKID